MSRHTGLLLPLFSAASTYSWGLGELSDIGPLAAWAAACGADRLMLLPIGTMADDQSSPYSAASAMAIDPIYIRVADVSDFETSGGVARLSDEGRAALDDARRSAFVRYELVRRAKAEALAQAFDRFVEHEWARHTDRAEQLIAYIARECWWLDDYALFRALSGVHSGSWRDWPEPIRDRHPEALREARRAYSREILRHQYLQWVAEDQWQRARASAEQAGVAVFGDLPFVVNLHSADVWTHADEFMLDLSLGVPPDAFSETGQDWGLPVYRWDVMAARDFGWLRRRARRMAALFSGFRLDHLVGFYRTYGRAADGSAFFTPPDEPAQIAQGETVVRIFAGVGAEVIVEDLGTIPDFVRESLARLGIAGSKVLRWERRWHDAGQPFIEPREFAPCSCALTSTHDTETLADWWDHASADERDQLVRLPLLQERGCTDREQVWDDRLRDTLLELAATAGSDELFIAVQDVFGWRDRINIPGTVGEHNWTWRLPWPVDQLEEIDEARQRAAFVRELVRRLRR